MKTFGATMMMAAAAAAVLGTASVQATEILRAHYEIRVATHGGENAVRSTFETPPGRPFTLNLPPNIVAMSVKRITGENYELEVTVTPAKGQQGNKAVFTQVYQGVLGRPLELKSSAKNADAVQVDGAISLVVLNK